MSNKRLISVVAVACLAAIACDSAPPSPSVPEPGDGDGDGSSGDGDVGDGDTGNGDVGDGDGDGMVLDDNVYVDPGADTTPRPAPDFGERVFIFRPDLSTPDMQGKIDEIFSLQETAQMEEGRFAFLVHPGQYNLDFNIGYYTEVMGLGQAPGETVIDGAVRSEADWFGGNSTHNFWRSASNLRVIPTVDDGFNRWAVSQAAPFRRMHISGDLVLDDGGWSSGGFLADSIVDGTVNSGSQQQWFTRNAQLGNWQGAVWNMFFLGMHTSPPGFWPPITVVEDTSVLREKPFLFVNAVGNYYVHVPDVTPSSRGVSWTSGKTPGRSIAIEQFHIAHPGDDAASMNAALSSGKNLFLTPGIYPLSEPVRIERPGTVVLGLGLPTLLATAGNVLMEIADVSGVKVAGLTIDAGTTPSPTLMRVGSAQSDADHEANPTSLHDVFCRIGGGFPGSADGCVEINSDHVIGDHFWLWRADHGNGVNWNENVSKNGLVVNGDDVTIYGLFVEHFHQYQTLWTGERGRVYFYQCEMPYDPPSQEAWQHDGVNGYAGYKVADDVAEHEAWGLGVYAVFHDAPVVADQAFEVPDSPGVTMHHMVTRSLGGSNGSIASVINGQGEPANSETEGATFERYPPLP